MASPGGQDRKDEARHLGIIATKPENADIEQQGHDACLTQKRELVDGEVRNSSYFDRKPTPLALVLLSIAILSLLWLPSIAGAGSHELVAAASTACNASASTCGPLSGVPMVSDQVAQTTEDACKTRWFTSPLGRLVAGVRGAASRMPLLKRQIVLPGFPAPRRTVMQCLEVSQPVLMPSNRVQDEDSAPCSVLLMDHVFGFSYDKPFVGNYTPPNCDFNRVVMNFSVVSAGRQFDRLALMYLNDTEVWRTSTAEPVASPGIHWEYHKDMTQFLSLWKKPQTVIFDLGNLIDANYTASFNTTLRATFFKDDVETATAPPADVIIPITSLKFSSNAGNPTSVFLLPEQKASRTVDSFPRNANRAVLSIQANGQAMEEFWWSNFLQSDVAVFNATTGMAPGMSPFREVAAMIDGKVAGFQWPFPVIFTGGVVPTLHRPVVGLQAFNLREHEIDITPWLPLLCDGNPHTISFSVSGLLDDDGKTASLSTNITSSWFVTGKVFVWLDDETSITTGSTPEVQGEDASIRISHTRGQDQQGRNQTLKYDVAVKRSFIVTSTVKTQKSTFQSEWQQVLTYDNKNNVTNYGRAQVTEFNLVGSDSASSNGRTVYGQDYSYPLTVDMRVSTTPRTNLMTLSAGMYQGMTFQIAGKSVFPDGLEAFAGTRSDKYFKASVLSTFRDGSATFQSSPGPGRPSTGSGSIRQRFAFGGNFERYPDISAATGVGPQPDVMLYYRNLTVINGVLTRDRKSVADMRNEGSASSSSSTALADFAVDRQVVDELAPNQVLFGRASEDELTPPRIPGSVSQGPTDGKFGVGYGAFMARRWA